jgi:hypothetical protein
MDAGKPSIRQLLDKPVRTASAPTPSNAETESESEYSAFAHGRISRLPQMTLILRLADGSARAFAYSYFYGAEAVEPDHGFTLDFSQHRVKIAGRNLEPLFHLLCQHRVAEIREAERSQSFEVASDAPLVERIEVVEALSAR